MPRTPARPSISVHDVVGVAVGIGALLGAAALARRTPTRTETRLFRAANDLPGFAYPAVWIPMQYGTYATVPATAALAVARRRPRLALGIAGGGTAAWLLAKVVKRIVDRGRPVSVLGSVQLRGKEEGDRGFPSGHAAVSAALTVVAWPLVPRGWRAPLAALSGFVPFARMYVGAHLPLDVVGGSALHAGAERPVAHRFLFGCVRPNARAGCPVGGSGAANTPGCTVSPRNQGG